MGASLPAWQQYSCDIWATLAVVTIEMIPKKPFLFLLTVQSHKLNDLGVAEGGRAFRRHGTYFFTVFYQDECFM